MTYQARPVEQSASWLAMYGCCAPRRDSIHDYERSVMRSRGEIDMQICYDQPQLVPQPRAESTHTRPTTGHSMGHHISQWVSNGREFATRASSRTSIHTISRPRKSFARSRPNIGLPTDFRRCDGVEGIQSMVDLAPMPVRRRRSFNPLELSIYLPERHLSPLPDFLDEEWDKLQKPGQAVIRDRTSTMSTHSTSTFTIQRKPVGSGSRPSSLHSQNTLASRPASGSFSTMPFVHEEAASTTAERPSGLHRRSSTQATPSANRILSRLPSPSRARSNTAPTRPGSLRRAKTDVDDAIRELNTIVEERRADAYRSAYHTPWFVNKPPPSPSHHVPAIAPSLRMHVRSETLSDIGSAFSVPLAKKTNKPLPITPEAYSPLPHSTTEFRPSPPVRTHSGPLNSNPITPVIPSAPTTPIHRLGSWLRRSIPTAPSTPAIFKSRPTTPKSQRSTIISAPMPFYQCELEPPLPNHQYTDSRPSTSGSRTLNHTRQDSNETATVTLFSRSSLPSTPALSIRSSHSSSASEHGASPPTPAAAFTKKVKTKSPKRVPAPLILCKEIEVEKPLASGRSTISTRTMKPPASPNYGLLAGREITAREGMRLSAETRISAVGVAF